MAWVWADVAGNPLRRTPSLQDLTARAFKARITGRPTRGRPASMYPRQAVLAYRQVVSVRLGQCVPRRTPPALSSPSGAYSGRAVTVLIPAPVAFQFEQRGAAASQCGHGTDQANG